MAHFLLVQIPNSIHVNKRWKKEGKKHKTFPTKSYYYNSNREGKKNQQCPLCGFPFHLKMNSGVARRIFMFFPCLDGVMFWLVDIFNIQIHTMHTHAHSDIHIRIQNAKLIFFGVSSWLMVSRWFEFSSSVNSRHTHSHTRTFAHTTTDIDTHTRCKCEIFQLCTKYHEMPHLECSSKLELFATRQTLYSHTYIYITEFEQQQQRRQPNEKKHTYVSELCTGWATFTEITEKRVDATVGYATITDTMSMYSLCIWYHGMGCVCVEHFAPEQVCECMAKRFG